MNQAKAVRKRTLNIIYFVDSDRTRSVQLATSKVAALCVGLGLLVLWFFVSAILGYFVLKDRIALLELVKETRSTLFDYESRFEDVFAVAYPYEPRVAKTEQATQPPAEEVKRTSAPPARAPDVAIAVTAPAAPAPAARPVPASPQPAQAAPEGAKGNSPEAAAASAPDQPDQQDAKAAASAPEHPAPAHTGMAVTVDSPAFRSNKENLELRVNINNNGKRKAEGFVWAIATFKPDAGDDVFVVSPRGMEISPAGETTDTKNAQRYAIQYLKPKNFVFSAPANGAGKFTQVKILLQDYEGQRQEFTFPVTAQ